MDGVSRGVAEGRCWGRAASWHISALNSRAELRDLLASKPELLLPARSCYIFCITEVRRARPELNGMAQGVPRSEVLR